jgi:6-phosphogluconolactonase (cycloisomerase 2 family)
MLCKTGLLALLLTLALAQSAGAVQSVYVTNAADSTVSQLTVGLDGSLSAKSPATLGVGTQPWRMAVSPDGLNLYVANFGTTAFDQDSVSQFDIDPSTGALTAKTPATVNVDQEPSGLAVSPDGSSLYVVSQDQSQASGKIDQFDISSGNGTISPKTPASITVGKAPRQIAVSPEGNYAYLTITGTGSPAIQQLTVDSNGKLALNGTQTTVGANPDEISVSSDGSSVYVQALNGGGIDQYDATAGVLTAKSPLIVTTTSTPYNLALHPDGATAYVMSSSGAVNQFAIDPNDGSLNALTPPTASCCSAASGTVAIGRMYYASSYSNDAVYLMPVDPNTDLLSDSGTPVIVGDGANGIVATPDQGPAAAFSAGTGSVAGGQTGFDASASNSAGAPISTYSWDFGDGQGVDTSAPTVSHSYAAPGNYTTTLQVIDANSCSDLFVFTGQTASCASNPSAITSHSVTVSSKGVPLGPGSAITISKLKAKFKKKKLTITLNSSAAGSVKFAFAKKKGKKFKSAGSATKTGKAGANTFVIKKKLKKGSYRLTATPAGGAAVTATFKVK